MILKMPLNFVMFYDKTATHIALESMDTVHSVNSCYDLPDHF